MRSATRNNLQTLLRQLRDHRVATAAGRRNVLKALRDDAIQDEFLSRVREKYKINVDNLAALLQLFVEYAPQLLKILADVIALFSK